MNRDCRIGSVSQTLAAAWAGRSTTLAVWGQHARVVNMMTGNGEIIALVVNPQDRGPFHLQGTPALLQDPPVAMAWPRLQGRTWTQDCRLVPQWQDKLRQPAPVPSRLLALSDPLLASLAPDTAWMPERRELRARIRDLQTVLTAPAAPQRDALAYAVMGLVGLGSGLTPAGDDVLMGVQFMLQQLAPHSAFWADRYVHWQACILAVPVQCTTRISHQWLYQAACGHWNFIWHALAAALGSGNADRTQQALATLARMGHTSGRYALTGLQTVLALSPTHAGAA